MTILKQIAYSVLILSLLLGCTMESQEPENPIQAEAGEPSEAFVGLPFVLDGTKSSHKFGEMLTYYWELENGPNGADYSISGDRDSAAKFTPGKEGFYSFRLTVRFGQWSASDLVIYEVKNHFGDPMDPDAGPDLISSLGDQINLNGSATKYDGSVPLRFFWEIISRPERSKSQISNPDRIESGFRPDQLGEYIIKLTVFSGYIKASDLVNVRVVKNDPGENSPIVLNEDITSDLVLKNVYTTDYQRIDYLVTKDILVKGSNLIIEPGVRVGFEQETGIEVLEGGTLFASSSDPENLPIVFQGNQPQKGFWDGITLKSDLPGSVFKGVEIRDAGKLGYGLQFSSNSILIVTESKIHLNQGIGVMIGEGVKIERFEFNRVIDNTQGSLQLPVGLVSSLSSENEIQINPILVTGSVLPDFEVSFWNSFGAPYELTEGLAIQESATWVIDSGVRLLMGDNTAITLDNGGSMRIQGTSEDKVSFESKRGEIGAWKGIFIKDSGLNPSIVSHTVIKHAGRKTTNTSESSTLYLEDDASLQIRNSTLSEGAGNGIQALGEGIKLEFVENKINDHYGRPVHIEAYLVENLDFNSVFESNRIQEVLIEASRPLAKSSDETIWKGFKGKVPYVIGRNGQSLSIHSGLRIKQGVTLKMRPSSSLFIQNEGQNQGYLTLEGTLDDPVIIQGTFESPGSWKGIIYATSHHLNEINHAEINHAGMENRVGFSSSITLAFQPNGRLNIRNSKIEYSNGHGIAVPHSLKPLLSTHNLVFENVRGDNIFFY